jgi:glycosyltransferase involved in cell wall biosynthesis
VLDSITNHKLNKSTTLSIIIPYYDNLKNIHKTLLSINFQENIDFKNIEVIIINDGGKIVDFILNFKYKFKLIIINNFNNFGAAISRNIGCAYSKKKYLLFLDSDVVLESNYLYQHLLRHQNFKNIITLSLYKTIKITDSNIFDYKIKQSNLKVKKLNDFRWNINLNTLLNKKLRKRKILNLMKETNYFKDFGFGKKIEYWSLPNMITTSNLMVSKNTTNAVGGFDSCFKFAQWEDTAIGAKFIATNQIVIPCLATNIFKIHHRRKYNFKKYFFENESEYNALLQKPIRLYSKSYLFKKYLSKKYIKNIITIKGVYCAYNKN